MLVSSESFLEASSYVLDGADAFVGSDGADNLFSFNGADSVSGGLGNDTVHGGSGNDTIEGDGGGDTLVGGFGDDLISGGDDADLIYGGRGGVEDSLLDQGQLFGTDGNVDLGTDFYSQSITAGFAGHLAAIEVQYKNSGDVKPIQYAIYAGGNPVEGTPLYSEYVDAPELEDAGGFRWVLPEIPPCSSKPANGLFLRSKRMKTASFSPAVNPRITSVVCFTRVLTLPNKRGISHSRPMSKHPPTKPTMTPSTEMQATMKSTGRGRTA